MDAPAAGNAAPSAPTNGASAPDASPSAPAGTQVIPSKQSMSSGPDLDSDGGESKAAPKPKPQKHKVKRGGAEVELEVEQALSMLSDDYEHEIPMGKETRKARWPDLVRGYQMSDGAFARMQQAAEMRKQTEGLLEWGKQPTNIGAFLETQLGVQDHRQWAAEVIKQQIKEEAELTELLNSNPADYHRRQEERIKKDLLQREDFARRQKQAEEAKAARVQRQKELDAQVTEALKGAGLPVSDAVKQIAARVYRKYADVGYELPFSDLAAMTRDEYQREIHGFIGGLDEERLLGFLGDELRKKLRQLELAGLKGASKKSEPKDDDHAAPRRDKEERGITPNEFLRRFRS